MASDTITMRGSNQKCKSTQHHQNKRAPLSPSRPVNAQVNNPCVPTLRKGWLVGCIPQAPPTCIKRQGTSLSPLVTRLLP